MGSGLQADARAVSDAYDEWLAAQREAGELMRAAGSPTKPLEWAEGFRYLSRLSATALWIFVEHGDPMFPVLYRDTDEVNKLTADNPDNLYLRCAVDGGETYRLWGNRGEAPYVGITLDAGIVGGPGERQGTLSQQQLDGFGISRNEDFEIILSPVEHSGNWIRLEPEAWSVLVRQTFFDKASERPADLRIERLGQDRTPAPLDARRLVAGLRRASRFAVGWTRIVLQLRDSYSKSMNELVDAAGGAKREYGGDPDIHYVTGYWKLGSDEALVIDVRRAERFVYWGFQLCNDWLESLDYRYFRVAINHHAAKARADGSVRLVVARQDPEVPNWNWLQTAGHSEGAMFFRWLLAGDDPPVPEVRVVKLSELHDQLVRDGS